MPRSPLAHTHLIWFSHLSSRPPPKVFPWMMMVMVMALMLLTILASATATDFELKYCAFVNQGHCNGTTSQPRCDGIRSELVKGAGTISDCVVSPYLLKLAFIALLF